MRRFLATFLAMCCLMTVTSAQKVYLVAAGVGDYPGADHDLRLPAMDARTINRLYRTNSSAETMLLTDDNATVSNIKAGIRKLFKKAGKDDIVVFFFSGHGYPGGFMAYDGNLTYDVVKKLFAESISQNKMIFADACFSGDIRGKGDAELVDKSGMNLMLLLSSRDDEFSYENPKYKNGYFTICLERCLRGGADTDHDRVITAVELYLGVREGVMKLTSGEQHPVMWGNFDDNMPVIVW